MGLIKCPDCGKEFSDRIDACPNCACPIEEAKKELEKELVSDDVTKKNSSKSTGELNTNLSDESSNGDANLKSIKHQKNRNLMTKEELFDFVVEYTMPYIIKELGNNVKVKKGIRGNNEPDFYLKTPTRNIGLNFVISIAPCMSNDGYDEVLAEKIFKKGYEFAVARVGVGSRDKYKFNRRIVEKDDLFFVNYKKLQFFDYQMIHSARYSLSVDTTYKEIYNRKPENPNSLTIKKTTPYFYNEYIDDKLIGDVLGKYNINEEFYKRYFRQIAKSVDYRLKYEDLVVNFLNCIDIVDGMVLLDDVKVKDKNIIRECIKYLDENQCIDLENYDMYWFAYYVYYFLINGRNNSKVLDEDEYIKMKIDLYEKDPTMFGFKKDFSYLDDSEGLQIKKNVYKMNNYIKEFACFYKEYVEICLAINDSTVTKAINFNKYANIFDQYYKEVDKMRCLITYSLKEKDVPEMYKDQYFNFKSAIEKFQKLLMIERTMMKNLSSKANGGKYGYFKYRKDQKESNLLRPEFVEAAEKLIDSYLEKTYSKEMAELLYIVKDITESTINNYINENNMEHDLVEYIKEISKFKKTEENEKFIVVLTDILKDMIQLIKDEIRDDEYYDFERETLLDLKAVEEKVYDMLI